MRSISVEGQSEVPNAQKAIDHHESVEEDIEAEAEVIQHDAVRLAMSAQRSYQKRIGACCRTALAPSWGCNRRP